MSLNNLKASIAPLALVVVTDLACGGGAAAGADLNGTWSTACVQTQNGTHAKTVLTYENLSLTGAYQEYSDPACQTGYNTARWTGTAVVGAETSAGVKKLDLSYLSFKNTPLSAAAAMGESQYQYCGFTDWAVDLEKDVLGKPCMNFAIPVGGKSLDLYQVSGTTLKFGQGAKIATTLTEADRPSAIDETRVFDKL